MARSLVKVAVGVVCAAWLTGCGMSNADGDRDAQQDVKRGIPANQLPTQRNGVGSPPFPVSTPGSVGR